jgi:lysophospholipase L1-like esterase
MNVLTYLALGDSYTIGEAVPLQNNFPCQTVQLLRNKGLFFSAPEIIAKTGWTSGELIKAINKWSFLPRYDFVSLLIGVNNQYRGLSINEFRKELEQLIEKAIGITGNQPGRVALLSIPDYSITLFAEKLDKNRIASELAQYNMVNKELAFQYKLHYIDLQSTDKVESDREFIAPDGLHPSEKLYSIWAKKLAEVIFLSAKR